MAHNASFQRTRPATARPGIIVDVHDVPVEDEEAVLIYRWLDSLQFSRSKKTASNRDFADGVMMAELVAHYIPKVINATYYIPTSSMSKKIWNWEHLNSKVFKRIGFQITPELIKDLAAAKPGMIERVLKPIQPILFKGPRAVLPLLKRLENVKARYMDLKKKDERPSTSQDIPAPRISSPRPRSARAPRSAPLRKPAAPELEVIKTPRPSTRSTYRTPPPSTRSKSPAERLGLVTEENYDIFTRPSTARSSNGGPSPTDLLNEINNLNQQLDQQEHIENAVVSSNKQRGFPARSSWLPVEGEESRGTNYVLVDADDDVNGNSNGNPIEEEADDEIYCDQSGYEEDTEDEDGGATDGEGDVESDVVFLPSSGDTVPKRSKRKMKRVVKYEYREEYILNGMASFQLPNSAQLENVRRDYMSPGNKDPNCRGYGFV